MGLAETAATQFVKADNGVQFAYRRFGKGGTTPLVAHIHFRGNMDFWDPLLTNTLAEEREVILFDNAGVGKSTGTVPTTFTGWAADMVAFIRALGLEKVDLLGFSMGGLAVTLVALNAPELVRKLVIAGSTASVPTVERVAGVVWPREQSDSKFVQRLAGAVTVEEGREAYKYSLFPHTPAGEEAFEEYWAGVQKRETEPAQLEMLPLDAGGNSQIAAIMDADVPNPMASFDRLGELKLPVLVANGDDDVLIATSRSWELLTQIDNAQLIIYPRSGHGFIWQYARRVAEDINRFLDGTDFENN